MTDITSEQSILDSLDINAEKESLALMNKNDFVLKIINKIGTALDKKYKEIKEFDFEANIEDFFKLFDYFYSLCDEKEKSLDKHVALYFISTMITQNSNIDDNCKNIINKVMEIIVQNDYLKDKKKRDNLMIDLINGFKPLLSEELNKYMQNYRKLFGFDIATLFELLIHFLTNVDTGNEDILYFAFKALTKRYKKLVISSAILDSKEVKASISIGSLNELLQLKLKNEQKIIVFENSHFLIRDLNIKELDDFIKGDFLQKIKNYKYGNLGKDDDSDTDEDKIKDSPKSEEIPFENVDIDSLEPSYKSIYRKVNELDKVVADLRQENFQLTFKVSILRTDLRKIKLRSLYKGIIDIFSSIYKIKIDDYYSSKLRSIINRLDNLPSSKKIIELKEFLLSIYSYLQKGNCLPHTIEEKTSPLEKIFWLVEKEKKKTFPYTKELLKNLNFDETLKYAENNYYSLKDKKKLLNNIKFSYDELDTLLRKD